MRSRTLWLLAACARAICRYAMLQMVCLLFSTVLVMLPCNEIPLVLLPTASLLRFASFDCDVHCEIETLPSSLLPRVWLDSSRVVQRLNVFLRLSSSKIRIT